MEDKLKPFSYYDFISEFYETQECAFCKMDAVYLHRYFENLLYENVNDPDLRANLCKSNGFCHRHAHILLSLKDPLGTAILYRDQFDLVRRKMKSLKKLNPKSLHAELEKQKTDNKCPACVSERQNRISKINTFLEWINDTELKQAFENSPGFCREHLFSVLEQTDNEKTSAYIIDVHLRKYSELHSELEEFIRKNDYRYLKEGFGSEGNSWSRAVKMLTGAKDVF